MSKLVLYGMDISPPVRACKLTLAALGLDYEYKVVDLLKGEHMSEEFLKHNPQHTVPVLDDNGEWLWDSHAICAYLVDKYGKDDKLYPKDLLQRARVQQRMYFEASVLYMSLRDCVLPMYISNSNHVPKEKTQNVIEGYNLLETFIGENPYVLGDKMTIADFCCVALATSLTGIVDINPTKYPKIHAWIERMSKLPYYEEANGKGVRAYVGFLKSKLTDIVI